MTPTTRISTIALLSLTAAWLGTVACSEDNPATNPTTAAGGTAAPSTGGTTAASTGGTTASTGGEGGTSSSTGGTATSSGTCPTDAWLKNYPTCGTTGTGESIAKNVACTATDAQECYKNCGPGSIGRKLEKCTNGAYVETSSCVWDTSCDYSCYKVPATADASCPATAPQHGTACTVGPCIVCGGTTAGQTTGYSDSSGAAKAGFCICLPATETTTQKWSCGTAASSVAWPCPGNTGC